MAVGFGTLVGLFGSKLVMVAARIRKLDMVAAAVG